MQRWKYLLIYYEETSFNLETVPCTLQIHLLCERSRGASTPSTVPRSGSTMEKISRTTSMINISSTNNPHFEFAIVRSSIMLSSRSLVQHSASIILIIMTNLFHWLERRHFSRSSSKDTGTLHL